MIMNNTTGKPLAVVTGASSGIGRELAGDLVMSSATICRS
jgi:short-subunit dehydrogenase